MHVPLDNARAQLAANGFIPIKELKDSNGEWWWTPGKYMRLFLQHCKEHENCCDGEQLQHMLEHKERHRSPHD